jgi:porin
MAANAPAYGQDVQSTNDQASPPSQPGIDTEAGGAQPSSKAPDFLLGDLGGVRSNLGDAGVRIGVNYGGEFATNLSGGTRKDATLIGQLVMRTTLDMERIAGIKGGTFQGTVTYRHGPNLTERAGLGLLQQVQEAYGRGQTWRLTEFWYQQIAADGHVIVKVGRMPAGDFNSFDCEFMNLIFCGAMSGNITGNVWLNWPISQWLGWVRVRSDRAYIKAGIGEDNRNNLDNAFFLSRGGAKGVILHGEGGYTPTFGGRSPGYYRAGFWYTTANDDDTLLDVNRQPAAVTGLPPLQRQGQYGFYIQAQQQLTGSATRDQVSDVLGRSRGLAVFFNFARNDPRTSTQLDQQTAGFYYTAPFMARPRDQIGFAVGRSHYNSRAARRLEITNPGLEKPTSEYTSELFYAAPLIPGFSIRPNVQFIMQPGGVKLAGNVLVFGTRFDVAL